MFPHHRKSTECSFVQKKFRRFFLFLSLFSGKTRQSRPYRDLMLNSLQLCLILTSVFSCKALREARFRFKIISSSEQSCCTTEIRIAQGRFQELLHSKARTADAAAAAVRFWWTCPLCVKCDPFAALQYLCVNSA